MLKIINLETTYKDIILALRGISLAVPPGQIVTLLGANGAGKTTTINTVSGIKKTLDLKIEGGTVEFEGEILNQKAPHEIVARGILQVPEGRRVFAELSVEENIVIGAYSRKGRKEYLANVDRVFSYFPILKSRCKQEAGYLSGGEQQMLVIGRALMATPKLIMMDEPSLGLAPLLVKEIFQLIGKINSQEDVAILLVEQNANLALEIAHHGYILENGRVVMEGPGTVLQVDRDIKEFYLGLSERGTRKELRQVKHYKRRKRWLS